MPLLAGDFVDTSAVAGFLPEQLLETVHEGSQPYFLLLDKSSSRGFTTSDRDHDYSGVCKTKSVGCQSNQS